jgi:hypothetical protein
VKCVLGRFGAASTACNSTFCPALRPPTSQVDVPDGAQTENVGRRLLGRADNVIFAVPPVPLVSQIQMANPTFVCGSTALTRLSVCIVRHSVPGGGVVGVVVGVAVEVGVVVGLALELADCCGPPGWSGACELVLRAGPGCGSPLGCGVAELPGLGWGIGGGLALGLGWVLGSGGGDVLVVWLAAAYACPAVWLAPACAAACAPTGTSLTTSARRTDLPAGCCATMRAAVRARGGAPIRSRGGGGGSSLGARAFALESGAFVLEASALALDVVEDEQEITLAWRAPCTPVRSMLTAP